MSKQKYEGIIWPPMIQDPVKRVEDTLNFPHKDGDLFVCSYPRTGKTSIYLLSVSMQFRYALMLSPKIVLRIL